MDLRSPIAESYPEVERAATHARLIGFGAWGVGWIFLVAAWLWPEPWFFAAFAAWYLVLAGLIVVVAAIPRRRQRALDQEWTRTFREMAIRDELTGLFNRRYFNSVLETQIRDCQAAGLPLSIALVDLNGFKSINDSFGHPAGDMALRIAGQAIVDAAPPNATVARTGGDEFAVIMPGVGASEAEMIARRIRGGIESATFVVSGPRGGVGRIRAAIGLATDGDGGEPGELLQLADNALYSRKRELRQAG